MNIRLGENVFQACGNWIYQYQMVQFPLNCMTKVGNFPFFDCDVPRRTWYGVYISQLIRFVRVTNENVFNCRNKALTWRGYRYHKLRKAFSKSYRRRSGLVEKYYASLRKLLQQGISEPEFYGDIVYGIRKIMGKSNLSEQFRKLINRYKRVGYSPYILKAIRNATFIFVFFLIYCNVLYICFI